MESRIPEMVIAGIIMVLVASFGAAFVECWLEQREGNRKLREWDKARDKKP